MLEDSLIIQVEYAGKEDLDEKAECDKFGNDQPNVL